MLGLLASAWIGLSSPQLGPTVTPAFASELAPITPVELAAAQDLDVAPSPAAEPEPAPRLSPGKRLILGSGIAYGLGAAIMWTTAGASGMLGDRRPGGTSGVTLGMTLGGISMAQSPVLAAIAGRSLAKASTGRERWARPMLGGGIVLTGLGAGAIIGSAMLIPTIRPRCPIGAGCVLAAGHLGGIAVDVGVGMMAYGQTLRMREPGFRRLSHEVQSPLIAGSILFATGYLLSATFGMLSWQDDPGDPVGRRTRNRLLVPIVGPWIHAAGPDAPMFEAVVTGGLGALQIAGTVALVVGASMASAERQRSGRAYARVVPSGNGLALVGEF